MRKYAFFLLAVFAISLFAPAAFAQGGGRSVPATNWVALAAGFSMAIASAGGAIGQGMATAHACEGLARNPGAEAAIRFALILGCADRIDGALHVRHHLPEGQVKVLNKMKARRLAIGELPAFFLAPRSVVPSWIYQ